VECKDHLGLPWADTVRMVGSEKQPGKAVLTGNSV